MNPASKGAPPYWARPITLRLLVAAHLTTHHKHLAYFTFGKTAQASVTLHVALSHQLSQGCLSSNSPSSSLGVLHFVRMAVLDAHPGLTTKVTVNKEPLVEYDDEEAEASSTEVTKYIETRSRAEFDIKTTFSEPLPTSMTSRSTLPLTVIAALAGNRTRQVLLSYC